MIVATRVKQRWDTKPYRTIVSASVRPDRKGLVVCFEDGTGADLAPHEFLPDDAPVPDWTGLTFSPHEVVVPTASRAVEVSWLAIRAATDPEFEAHLQEMGAEEDRLIGRRIAELRQDRGLSAEALARQVGLPPDALVRIEEGRGEATFSTLEHILGVMGATLDDLIVEPEPAAPPEPTAPHRS